MQFSVYTYEVKMSRWLKNNTLNCKWTLQIWFGKDSRRFSEARPCIYNTTGLSEQSEIIQEDNVKRPDPHALMQIPLGGINLIRWNIFLRKKKKMSKPVGSVTKVSHLMRNSVRKKLWKSTHFKVRLRTKKNPCTQASSPTSTTDGCASFQWGEKCLNIKTEIISGSTFDLDVYYTWASSHSKTFGERDWVTEFYTCSEETG